MRGLTAPAAYTPFGGDCKRILSRLTHSFRTKPSRDQALAAWVCLLALAALGMCVGLIAAGYRIDEPFAVAVFAVLAIAAERQIISLTPNAEVSVSMIVYVFVAVVLGPLSGAVVAAASVLANLPRRDNSQPILRWGAWTSCAFISAGLAGLAAAAVAGASSGRFWGLFAAVVAAFVVETVTELGLASVSITLRGGSTMGAVVRSVGPAMLASVPLYAPMIAVLAYSYETVSPWSVVLFAIPAVAAQRLLHSVPPAARDGRSSR